MAGNVRPDSRVKRPAARRRLLTAIDHGPPTADALDVALQQATADLHGIGALVHWRAPGADRLRLVAVGGLAPEIAETWADLSVDSDTAPARAVRRGAVVWVVGDGLGTGASGTAAVPFPGIGSCPGTLSVLTAGPGEPDPDQWSFLCSVATWAAGNPAHAPHVVSVRHWQYDATTGSVTLTPPVIDLAGASQPAFDERADLDRDVSGIDPRVFAADVRTALRRGRVYDAEYRVRYTDGTAGWVRARGHIESGEDGATARMVGTLWLPTRPHQGDHPAAVLLRDMGEAFLAVDENFRITFVNREAERVLGPGRTLLGRPLWEVPAGGAPDLEAQCRRVAAERKAISLDLHWPTCRRIHRVRFVPLRGAGLTVCFAYGADEPAPAAGRSAGERTAAERSARMSELTAALAEAVTSADVVKAVADRVLPPFGADGLLVDALEGSRLHVIGSVGYAEDFLPMLDGISLKTHMAITEVLRTRTPRFVESAAEYHRFYPGFETIVNASGKNAWVFLPLIASGHTIGCCVISFSQPRSFSEEERTLLIALSGLIGQALERARLYDMEHNRAQNLQRGLLPRMLPDLSAAVAAARYMPAGKGEEVGGDWYDLIPLSGDRVAIVIGDVMGHGIAEAAIMAQLRMAVRTLADLELSPDELLTHLSELVADLGDDKYATCSYAVFDPVTRICSLCLAGHLPPAVVRPDGSVHFPELVVNPPLGAAEPPFETDELLLPADCLLVFFTDGLVESASRDIDEGVAQLRQTLTEACAEAPYFVSGAVHDDTARLEALCDVVVSTLLPDCEQTCDDAVLLVTRTRATPADHVASCSLPDDPRAAGQAREYIREQLSAWDLDELAMTTELLVSELVGNVIRHAAGPMRLRLIRSRSLICEVYDGSLTSPRIRRAAFTDEGGRGLHLVAALSRRWGTRHLADGKCIWTEQDLPAVL
ncbi:SpoIIE family protein phosphatase [Streptomyces sp. NPDC001714]|uniref:SpoIIE family protein phosphatase n=1 Tax=Streptomyces sp. NPDC001714 TaxID=3364603 RepID=UPI0036862232